MPTSGLYVSDNMNINKHYHILKKLQICGEEKPKHTYICREGGIVQCSSLLKTHSLPLAIEETQLNMFYQMLNYLGKIYFLFLNICFDDHCAYNDNINYYC